MARLRTIRISALNVVSHPHSLDGYVTMFEKATKQRVPAIYFGNKAGMIGTFNRKDKNIYFGTLHLFTDFDQFSNWINLKTGEAADQKEVDAINLPENLRPELERVPFVFFAQSHRLFFDSGQLGPSSAQRLIEKILQTETVRLENQEVNVTVEQSREILDELLGRSSIKDIVITIVRPNADDLSAQEKRIYEKLRKIGAGTKIEEYKAIEGESIRPDLEIKQLARIALSNGNVEVTSKTEEGITEKNSTKDTPLVIPIKYDPQEVTAIDEIHRIGIDFLKHAR